MRLKSFPLKVFICKGFAGFFLLMLSSGPIRAAGDWACVGYTLAESVFPGLGYGLMGDFDKMLIFGGLRWSALSKYNEYSKSPHYQEEISDIYKETELENEKTRTDIYYSKETFYGSSYASIYSNLTYVTYYDLYDGNCEENPKTYGLVFSPFRIWDYGMEPTFWAPTIYVAATPMDGGLVNYHVDQDLSRDQMLRQSFLQYQLVGIGEEMLFRGVIQRSLFNLYSKGFSKGFSRWSSILTASALFGAAHTGQGFTATPAAAFIMGVYFGWLYHPADGEFNLVEPIAVHSWWDTILVHRMISESQFTERSEGETAKNANLSTGSRFYPLFGLRVRF